MPHLRVASFLSAVLAPSWAFHDVLQSRCYIHFRRLGGGLSDSSRRLCNLATFAAVHNCSAIVPPFNRSSYSGHVGGHLGAARAVNGSWDHLVDLRSNVDIAGSRCVFEASWNEETLQEECVCLKEGGKPPCKNGMACPKLLGEGWRWRSYDDYAGIKDLVRQLQLDIREKDESLRVYSYKVQANPYQVQPGNKLNGLSLHNFLMAANEEAVRQGLSSRRDLLGPPQAINGLGFQELIALPKKPMPRHATLGRLHPCGQGVSEDVRRYAAQIVATVLQGEAFAHLRIRRGDKTRRYPKKCSEPGNVARAFLKKMRQAKLPQWPRRVLVHSNEQDEKYWQKLKKSLQGAFDEVITERQLPSPPGEDNYFAYAAAPVFGELAAFAMFFHPITVKRERKAMCPRKLRG